MFRLTRSSEFSRGWVIVSPGRMPCPNYEAVEFQPRTVDNSALDSGCPARILLARRDEVNPHFNDKGRMNGYIGNDNMERNE